MSDTPAPHVHDDPALAPAPTPPTTATTTTTSGADPSAPSLQLLKETAELADITRADQQPPPERVPQDSEIKFALSADAGKPGSMSIETVYENAGIDLTASSVTAASRLTNAPSSAGASTVGAAAAPPSSPASDAPAEIHNAQQTARCGRMNKLRDHASNIFPAGIMGCRTTDVDGMPSPRRFLDAGEALHDTVGHIESTPRKAGVRNDRGRNPVLGTGVEVIGDPAKSTGDGPEGKANAARVPPGGYSHGLW